MVRALRSFFAIAAIGGVFSLSVQPAIAAAKSASKVSPATVRIFDKNGKEAIPARSAAGRPVRGPVAVDRQAVITNLEDRIAEMKSRKKRDPERVERYERWVRFLQAGTSDERHEAIRSGPHRMERVLTSGRVVRTISIPGRTSIELNVPIPVPAEAPAATGGPSADARDPECYEDNVLVECASAEDLEDLTYVAYDAMAEADTLQSENEGYDSICQGYSGCYEEEASDEGSLVSGPAAGEFESCRAKLAAAFVSVTALGGATFALLDVIAAALGEGAAISIMAALGWSLTMTSLITGAGIAVAFTAVCVYYWFQNDLMVPQRRIIAA